jgi:rsbT antagonist protein RsbS
MDDGYNRIPIIGFWDLLLVPLQGDMTDDMAGRLVSDVLERVHRDGSSGLIIDITGLWLVDSHLCAVLSQLAAAASLMGASTIISGMKPEIAMALETMGIRLANVTTTLDLETALSRLGVSRPDPAKVDLAEPSLPTSDEAEAELRELAQARGGAR